MTEKRIGTVLLVTLIFFSLTVICHARNYSEVEAKIGRGQSKSTVIKLLGEPLTRRITVKQQMYIWGPEEEFWDNIPMGTPLEVWKYEMSDGNLNLYFINGDEHLDFKAFAPKGVVY